MDEQRLLPGNFGPLGDLIQAFSNAPNANANPIEILQRMDEQMAADEEAERLEEEDQDAEEELLAEQFPGEEDDEGGFIYSFVPISGSGAEQPSQRGVMNPAIEDSVLEHLAAQSLIVDGTQVSHRSRRDFNRLPNEHNELEFPSSIELTIEIEEDHDGDDDLDDEEMFLGRALGGMVFTALNANDTNQLDTGGRPPFGWENEVDSPVIISRGHHRYVATQSCF